MKMGKKNDGEVLRKLAGCFFLLINKSFVGFIPVSSVSISFFGYKANWLFFKSYMALKSGSASVADMKLLAKFAELTDSHQVFEDICRKYDSRIEFRDYSHARFHGSGWGEGCLNVYREVVDQKGMLFEKVFFKASEDFLKLQQFYGEFESQLEGGCIKAPRIIEEKSGKYLSVVYFEFIDIDGSADDDMSEHENIVLIGKILRALSEVDVGGNLECKEKTRISDYLNVQHYREGVRFIDRMADEASGSELADIKDIRKKLDNIYEKLVFSHGDLVAANYSIDGWLWDWDRCGFYPVCFDMSWAVLNVVKFSSFEELISVNEDLISRCYHDFGSESELLNNAAIFSFVFYCRKFKPSREDKIFKEMCRYLRKRCTRPAAAA